MYNETLRQSPSGGYEELAVDRIMSLTHPSPIVWTIKFLWFSSLPTIPISSIHSSPNKRRANHRQDAL